MRKVFAYIPPLLLISYGVLVSNGIYIPRVVESYANFYMFSGFLLLFIVVLLHILEKKKNGKN